MMDAIALEENLDHLMPAGQRFPGEGQRDGGAGGWGRTDQQGEFHGQSASSWSRISPAISSSLPIPCSSTASEPAKRGGRSAEACIPADSSRGCAMTFFLLTRS